MRPANKAVGTAVPIAIECSKEFPERSTALAATLLGFGPQQQSGECRAQSESIEGGENHGNGDGQGELLIKSPGDARDERRGHEHRSQHQGNADDGSRELFHRLEGRVLRSQSLFDVALRAFDNHNRVVNHQADRQDQAQHRECVDREAE